MNTQFDYEYAIELKLDKRKITRRAAALFDIQMDVQNRGWVYPVPNGGSKKRFKNLTSKSSAKYLWPDGKPENADYYYSPIFHHAVDENIGRCWLVSGEADVWAMVSAGIDNVFSCGFSEANVPKDLIDFLRHYNISQVLIAPDKDTTGIKWASKIAARLHGSGIDFVAFRLPDSFGRKADVGYAWSRYDYIDLLFEDWLLQQPILPIELEQERKKKSIVHPAGGISYSDKVKGIKQRVEKALGITGYKPDGFSIELVHCPFHGDEHPSANLHVDKGMYCFADGEWFTWKRIFLKLLRTEQIKQVVTANQLSTEVREQLLQQGLTTTARFLDILFLCGFQPGQTFTPKSISSICAPYSLSIYGIYRILNPQYQTSKVKELKKDYFAEYFPLFSFYHEESIKSANKSKRGRPEVSYIFPSIQQIETILRMRPGPRHYDPMTPDALMSDKQYRVAVYSALPLRCPGSYTRTQLASRVGLSTATIRKYDSLAGLEVTHQFERRELTCVECRSLPSKRTAYYIWLETETGKKYPPTFIGGRAALLTNEKIFLVKQLANLYGPKPKNEQSENDNNQVGS